MRDRHDAVAVDGAAAGEGKDDPQRRVHGTHRHARDERPGDDERLQHHGERRAFAADRPGGARRPLESNAADIGAADSVGPNLRERRVGAAHRALVGEEQRESPRPPVRAHAREDAHRRRARGVVDEPLLAGELARRSGRRARRAREKVAPVPSLRQAERDSFAGEDARRDVPPRLRVAREERRLAPEQRLAVTDGQRDVAPRDRTENARELLERPERATERRRDVVTRNSERVEGSRRLGRELFALVELHGSPKRERTVVRQRVAQRSVEGGRRTQRSASGPGRRRSSRVTISPER